MVYSMGDLRTFFVSEEGQRFRRVVSRDLEGARLLLGADHRQRIVREEACFGRYMNSGKKERRRQNYIGDVNG